MTSTSTFFFDYKPSIAGVVVASLVFGAITAVHIHQFVTTFKATRIKVLVVLSMASFNELLGYVLRVPGSKSKPTGALYPLSPLLLLFTPLMATSVIYYIFNKISTNVAAQSAPVRPSLMLKVLSGVDVLSQIGISAGGMTASRSSDSTAGKAILMATLVVHILNVVAFMVCVAIWHRRAIDVSTLGSTRFTVSVQRDVFAVYAACSLIILRNLLRFIEFASGPNGAFQKHEAPFYIYEFLPVSMALIVCLQWYHSENLKTPV